MKSKKKSYDIVRWIALLPAVCLVWWVASSVCLIIDAWTSSEIFVLFPAIAMFFTAKWIAPKYKNLMGIFAVFVCLLWTLSFWYILGHAAY